MSGARWAQRALHTTNADPRTSQRGHLRATPSEARPGGVSMKTVVKTSSAILVVTALTVALTIGGSTSRARATVPRATLTPASFTSDFSAMAALEAPGQEGQGQRRGAPPRHAVVGPVRELRRAVSDAGARSRRPVLRPVPGAERAGQHPDDADPGRSRHHQRCHRARHRSPRLGERRRDRGQRRAAGRQGDRLRPAHAQRQGEQLRELQQRLRRQAPREGSRRLRRRRGR